MSVSVELQKLIYARLVADAGVHAICGDRIYDNPKEGVEFPYVSFGPSDQIEDDAECITGLVETMQIDCWSRYGGGFLEVKKLTDAVRKALHQYEGELTENALVEMRVLSTRFFRDPDGLTSHGVMSVQSTVEEP
tara:strand:+ start:563 stop:967 length:405 start_codon:yes stop_codon:yes gene_type:complete